MYLKCHCVYCKIKLQNIFKFLQLSGCQRTICFLSVAHAQHRQKLNYAESFFFMFVSNLRVKSPTKQIIENNIFEGMT